MRAIPVELFSPETCAVYVPGESVTNKAESALPEGSEKAPVAAKSALISDALELLPHPVFVAI